LNPGSLRAGIATVAVPSPIGVDTVGFLRRYETVQSERQPLETTALVVEQNGQQVVLIGLDLLGTTEHYGLQIRQAVAAAIGCSVEAVLVNSQHTHAAPPPPGMLKLGGLTHELTSDELAYWNDLVNATVSAAATAADRLAPARVGAASTELTGLTVNRRERSVYGTILGWNPDEACDQSVTVLRFDSISGDPIASVVNFACHPVVIGPDVHEASSDFVGPMRTAMRAWTGADCLFLQGCAGNILPLEAFMEEPGAEVVFGRRLALAALTAWSDADLAPMTIERSEYGSAVPIARYRRVPNGEFNDELAVAVTRVVLPLVQLPTFDEMTELAAELAARAATLKAASAGAHEWNPVEIHSVWAAQMAEQLREGTAPREISGPVHAVRIGDIAIVSLPGEAFNEIGTRIKAVSPASVTLCCGYTNAALGYLPTSEEYPFGGYEVAINHRHYGNPAPIAVGCDVILEAAGAELLAALFSSDRATT
jgi:neutral/alkaline ceramidase-like enzyme